MKKLLLSIAIAMVFQTTFAQYCGGSGPGVCIPSGSVTAAGFSPTFDVLPPLINGEIATVLQFKNFDTIAFGGQVLTVQSLRIDSIGNLPAGVCWNTNKTNNTWANQEDGCIAFNGITCSTPGQYKLAIIVTMNVGVNITTNLDAANLKYYFRVKNANDLEIPIDTTQTSNNPFIPYGNPADCSPVFSVNLGADQIVCNGSSVTLNPVTYSGIAPYTYNWSSSGPALSCTTCKHPQVIIGQTSTYTVTVLDATNASVTGQVTYTVTGNTNQVQFTSTSTGIDCANASDNTVVTATGGTGPYTFNWGDGSVSTTGNSPQAHTYTQPGTFVIGVSDNNGCVTSQASTVAFNGILITATQTTQPTCVNQNTGLIAISASGGTPQYSYNWSNGGTTSTINNLAAAHYAVTVTDATGCSFSKSFSLAPVNGWGYYVYTAPSGSNCNANGTINTTIYGGNSPYTFNWSNGATTEDLSALAGGVYQLTVTDATGCVATGAAEVPSSCYSLVKGTIFNDANNNCTFDQGEGQLQNIFVTAQGTGGETYYGYADNAGNYSIQIPASGSFSLGASTGYGACGILSLCNNVNHTVTFTTIGDTSLNNNFGFTGAAGFDLNIHPGWRSANPGFEKEYWIYCGNNAVTDFNGTATVTFNYDENLIFQSADNGAIHSLATHTLTWNVSNIQNNSSFWDRQLRCTFMVPQTLSLGHLLHSSFRMEPTVGDCDSSNNKLFVSETVIGSLDPNEKKVDPSGDILEEDSVLTYEIGFQNTGTDSTHFIIIKDTLSSYLDASTVRNIASSHPYSDFSISGTGILTWTFNPLRLVDSFTNEPGSHGFVRFTIKKKKNLTLNTLISNTAHIYFDYNTAVVTNTVTNTLTEPNGIWHIRSTEGITVKAFPNPFSEGTSIVVDGVTGRYDFELYDVTGKLNKRITSIETNQFFINRDNLSAGIYFFKVLSVDKKKSGYGKLVVE
ncbi:MAG TPA: T9SS type A sorting domain-containing protein [Chitinophagales bacterium]|nr:T9SS type A sorting domain-containing protein [Chitinophagales bacterium]